MQKISQFVATIYILDEYLSGISIENALNRWFKKNRFAGSNDRKQIRDLVFDILRKRLILFYAFHKSNYAENGRILVLAYIFLYKKGSYSIEEINNNKYFTPSIKNNELEILLEINNLVKNAPLHVKLNYPKFLEKKLKKSLGKNFKKIMESFQDRAPVYLRVNNIKTNLKIAKAKLKEEGIDCEICYNSQNALKVNYGDKFIRRSESYIFGNVELQDLSSQLTTELNQISTGKKILDYCAGSGGKAIAIASRLKNKAEIYAYDINYLRSKNIVNRAQRAGANIIVLNTNELKKTKDFFDLVFVDAPCSGTGIWRRDPEFKWKVNDQKLNFFTNTQYQILNSCTKFIKNGGYLIYVVCSLLEDEGDLIIRKFLYNNLFFSKIDSNLFHPINASDGFYYAVLKKN